MPDDKNLIALPRNAVATLALEIWRLWRIGESCQSQPYALPLRYSIKKTKQILEAHGASFVDLTDETYDAGMAVDVIDTEGEKTDEQKTLMIKEMIAPIILFNKELLSHGQVILQWKTKSNEPTQDGVQ
ncbi:hypothetical protein L0244_20070 [bacterium]|nr:hypothetical protein [bacterium]MCI0691280.1 hypothetical protein [candidate division KSB1 bacterium]